MYSAVAVILSYITTFTRRQHAPARVLRAAAGREVVLVAGDPTGRHGEAREGETDGVIGYPISRNAGRSSCLSGSFLFMTSSSVNKRTTTAVVVAAVQLCALKFPRFVVETKLKLIETLTYTVLDKTGVTVDKTLR